MSCLEVPHEDDYPHFFSRKAGDALKEEKVNRNMLGRFLWLAAKNANKEDVRSLLELRAPVDYELPYFSENALLYKERRYQSQAIHAAALYDPDEEYSPCPEDRRKDATQVVKLLLGCRANAMAKATSGQPGLRGSVRRCEAIHFAAGSGNSDVVSLLLESRASPDAGATLDKALHYMPLHDSVWFKRHNTLCRLLDCHADIKAKNKDGCTGLHWAASLGYSEIALEFILRSHPQASERVCIRQPAYPMRRRLSSSFSVSPHRIPSMVAQTSSLGSAPSEGLEPDTLPLEKVEDNYGKTPLDCAIESGQFPPQELWMFAYNLSVKDRASAFVNVAHMCPSAASALLRGKLERDGTELCGEEILPVDDHWKRCLQQGAAEAGVITPLVLASLINHAPQAAVDLLEALTEIPYVTNPANPLPIRARICSSSMMPLHAAYETDISWKWVSNGVVINGIQRGAKPWQIILAPRDPWRGQEVLVRVLTLPGVISLCVLHSLACTTDSRLFSMVQVHALLRHLWDSCFRLLFVLDLVHEAGSLGILSTWVLAKEYNSTEVNKALWCFLVAQSMTECLNYAAMSWNCHRLGARDLIRFWLFTAHDLLIPLLTLSLAYLAIDDTYRPRSHCIMLSVTVFSHWLRMLYQLRLFWWTGQRLLPVLKSIHSVSGMLIILGFLVMAFVHAFWALNVGNSPGLTLYQLSVMVISGNDFVDISDIEGMDESKRATIIVFVLLALFLVLTSALNVFIAVLGHYYELEHERLICTFMMERAKICCALFLRPSCSRHYSRIRTLILEYAKICCTSAKSEPTNLPTDEPTKELTNESTNEPTSEPTGSPTNVHNSEPTNWLPFMERNLPNPSNRANIATPANIVSKIFWGRYRKVFFASIATFSPFSSYFVIFMLTSLFSAPQWVSACMLTVALLSVRLVVRSSYVDHGDERFLWMCYAATLQDSMHLRNTFNDRQNASGQVLGMKQYVPPVQGRDIVDENVKPQVKEAARRLGTMISVDALKRKKQRRTQQRLELGSNDTGTRLEQIQSDLDDRMGALEEAIQRMSVKRHWNYFSAS